MRRTRRANAAAAAVVDEYDDDDDDYDDEDEDEDEDDDSYDENDDPRAPTKDKRKASVSVKVTNITKKVTAEQLRDLFGQFGTITSLNLRPAEGYSKPHCFINFSMPEEAAEAIKEMNNYKIRGKAIRCVLQRKAGSFTPKVRVFPVKASKLNPDITEELLQKRFGHYGEIAPIVLIKSESSAYAYINYYQQQDQRDAFLSLRNTKLLSRVISVTLQDERMIPDADDRGRTTSPQFIDPGPVVLPGGKIKSLGKSTSDRTRMQPPHFYPSVEPSLPTFRVHHQCAAHQHIRLRSVPSTTPPLPTVDSPRKGVYQCAIPMLEVLYDHVERTIRPHTDFHEEKGTFTSFRDGTFFVQGKDSNSVKFIAREAYEALQSAPAPDPPPPPMFTLRPASRVPTHPGGFPAGHYRQRQPSQQQTSSARRSR